MSLSIRRCEHTVTMAPSHVVAQLVRAPVHKAGEPGENFSHKLTITIDHVKRKVRTLTKNWRDHCGQAHMVFV